jgi:biopolymer transport protein ExbD
MTLNLAPMVDVMMCLIIFFLLATKLVDAQMRHVELPYAKSAHELTRSEMGARIVLNIRPGKTGQTEYIVNTWDGQAIGERALTPEEVVGYVAQKAARAVEDKEELRCVIRGDREVPYGDIEVALRACGLARVQKVIFSANSSESPADAASPMVTP